MFLYLIPYDQSFFSQNFFLYLEPFPPLHLEPLPEIDESQHGCVELDEDGHELHVYLGGGLVPEVVRHYPSHGLTLEKYILSTPN